MKRTKTGSILILAAILVFIVVPSAVYGLFGDNVWGVIPKIKGDSWVGAIVNNYPLVDPDHPEGICPDPDAGGGATMPCCPADFYVNYEIVASLTYKKTNVSLSGLALPEICLLESIGTGDGAGAQTAALYDFLNGPLLDEINFQTGNGYTSIDLKSVENIAGNLGNPANPLYSFGNVDARAN